MVVHATVQMVSFGVHFCWLLHAHSRLVRRAPRWGALGAGGWACTLTGASEVRARVHGWFAVCGVFPCVLMFSYFNGAYVSNSGSNVIHIPVPTPIYLFSEQRGNNFKGAVDDVRIWSAEH